MKLYQVEFYNVEPQYLRDSDDHCTLINHFVRNKDETSRIEFKQDYPPIIRETDIPYLIENYAVKQMICVGELFEGKRPKK